MGRATSPCPPCSTLEKPIACWGVHPKCPPPPLSSGLSCPPECWNGRQAPSIPSSSCVRAWARPERWVGW